MITPLKNYNEDHKIVFSKNINIVGHSIQITRKSGLGILKTMPNNQSFNEYEYDQFSVLISSNHQKSVVKEVFEPTQKYSLLCSRIQSIAEDSKGTFVLNTLERSDSRRPSETFTVKSNFHLKTNKGKTEIDPQIYELVE